VLCLALWDFEQIKDYSPQWIVDMKSFVLTRYNEICRTLSRDCILGWPKSGRLLWVPLEMLCCQELDELRLAIQHPYTLTFQVLPGMSKVQIAKQMPDVYLSPFIRFS
jgi:hypothetical protein